MIGLILLQAGKGADIGAAFGGASQTVFGGRGPATFLSKMTTIAAILFLVTSISLAHLSKNVNVRSVLDSAPASDVAAPVAPDVTTSPEEKAPVAPVAPAAQPPATK